MGQMGHVNRWVTWVMGHGSVTHVEFYGLFSLQITHNYCDIFKKYLRHANRLSMVYYVHLVVY